MRKQILLSHLLIILCVTLSPGFASLSNNATADSLAHLVRQKRVVDLTPHANTRVRRLQHVNYIVQVQKYQVFSCAGSILSARIILTLASCVRTHARYSVQSGTLSITGGTIHDVDGILSHPQFVNNFDQHDIALLSIEQPIILGPNLHQPITIYNSNNGLLPADSSVTVSGWGLAARHRSGLGCFQPTRGRPRLVPVSDELRSITLNTIPTERCSELLENEPVITQEYICTYHQLKYCGPGDNGDPLVFGGHLAGMLAWNGFMRGADVYVNVARPAHRQWIFGHMNRIPRYVQPPYRSPSPPPATPPRPHVHRRPQTCSQIHPCASSDSDA